jgi:hypothetical protein
MGLLQVSVTNAGAMTIRDGSHHLADKRPSRRLGELSPGLTLKSSVKLTATTVLLHQVNGYSRVIHLEQFNDARMVQLAVTTQAVTSAGNDTSIYTRTPMLHMSHACVYGVGE